MGSSITPMSDKMNSKYQGSKHKSLSHVSKIEKCADINGVTIKYFDSYFLK